jgi:hydroxyacylglutathione hydrolase
MNIECFTGGYVQTNGYLVEGPKGYLLIDAPSGVAKWLAKKGIVPTDVLLTHQHYDHIEDAAALQQAGAVLHAFADYSPELTLETRAQGWGLPIHVVPYRIDRKLAVEGTPLEIAGLTFELAHVPGHSPDSVTFHSPDHGVLFSGDTLFAGSVGRPDLPGGDEDLLLNGIRGKLLALPDDTRVFPGHGPDTTIVEERESNPYL